MYIYLSIKTKMDKIISLNTRTFAVSTVNDTPVLFSKCLEEQIEPLWNNLTINNSEYIIGIKYEKGENILEGGGDIQLFLTGTLRTNEDIEYALTRACKEYTNHSINNFNDFIEIGKFATAFKSKKICNVYVTSISDLNSVKHLGKKGIKNKNQGKFCIIVGGSYNDVMSFINNFDRSTNDINKAIEEIVFIRADVVTNVMKKIYSHRKLGKTSHVLIDI